MLCLNTVEKPCRGRLYLLFAPAHAVPVAQLVPLLVFDYAALKIRFAGSVFLKNGICLPNLIAAYWGKGRLRVVFRSAIFRRTVLRSAVLHGIGLRRIFFYRFVGGIFAGVVQI